MKKKILLFLTILSVFLCTNCKKSDPDSSSSNEDSNELNLSYEGSNTKVGMYYEILGNVKRNLPTTVSDEGNRYPIYGTSLENITEEEKTALIKESDYLKASDTTFNKMDKDGNLYLNDTKLDRKLYKHTTSLNTYYGCPSDSEEAVIKKITYNSRPSGNHITGLYAPAGEVITVNISEDDLAKTGGVKIEIGQYAQNNQLNNIWQARNDFSRMPLLGNEMLVSDTTSYVGAFLGGPIYVTPNNPCEFSITISGALEYTHFIYGLTTESEFERLKSCSAPYFDLEVYDACVRHSGPKKYANLDFENLNKISDLWLKISNISRQIPSGSSSAIGIDFIYDPFIAAGSAVAIVGRNWCNLPPDWMSGSLDYDSFITNGMWGTIHEYNHHFQRYGFEPGDEVTNNAINLLSYISYTKISEDRDNLSGWNRYLNPEVSLKETISLSANLSETNPSFSSLSTYADIIHTFGVDTFIKAAKYKNGSGGADAWYESLCVATNYNMEYYFSLLGQSVSTTLKEKYQKLPMFIPATLKEQTGRVINGTEITTVMPYIITPSDTYTLDLSTSLTLPSGFSYKLNKVSTSTNTKFSIKNNVVTIDASAKSKLNIVVDITNGTYSSTLTFIIELNPKYKGINVDTYNYESKPYKTAKEALNKNFEGYTNLSTTLESKHFINGIGTNQITSYYGKLYMNQSGTYKLSVRCSDRNDTYLEAGLNTKTYDSYLESPRTSPINCKEKYLTFNVNKGDYIYFRVTINSFHQDGFGELYGSYSADLSAINNSILFNEATYVSKFSSKDYYERTYSNSSFCVPYQNQKIVSYTTSYSLWDENYKIENIIDGNANTSYHSIRDKMISSEPFEVTIDLGDAYYLNQLNITTYNGNQSHYPIAYSLYAGTSLDSLELLALENENLSNRNLTASFNTTKIRYYKLVITDTSEHRYVALSDINLSLKTEGSQVSATNAKYFTNSKTNFELINKFSTFGRVVSGNGTLEIESTDGLGIITLNNNSKIEITIDNTSEIIEFNKQYYIQFSGKKKVKIKVLSDNIDFDSFIIK